jgi:hypothetical protein
MLWNCSELDLRGRHVRTNIRNYARRNRNKRTKSRLSRDLFHRVVDFHSEFTLFPPFYLNRTWFNVDRSKLFVELVNLSDAMSGRIPLTQTNCNSTASRSVAARV